MTINQLEGFNKLSLQQVPLDTSSPQATVDREIQNVISNITIPQSAHLRSVSRVSDVSPWSDGASVAASCASTIGLTEFDSTSPAFLEKLKAIRISYIRMHATPEQITDFEISAIYDYLEINEKEHLTLASTLKRSIYLQPTRQTYLGRSEITNKPLFIGKSGLARSIQFTSEGSVFVHLNRAKKNDLVLGEGSFKKANFAINLTTGKKIVSASSSAFIHGREEEYPLDNEIKILSALREVPGCISIIDSARYDGSLGGGRRQGAKQRFLMNYCSEGNLYNATFEHKIGPKDKKNIVESLITTLAEVHKREVIHGDLKPENVLLDKPITSDSIVPFLADFGASCFINDELARNTCITTPSYASPEYVQAYKNAQETYAENSGFKEAVTYAHDMWGLGCTILFILGKERKDLILGTLKEDQLAIEFPEPADKQSPEHLAWRMTQFKPEDRITAEDAVAALSSIQWPATA